MISLYYVVVSPCVKMRLMSDSLMSCFHCFANISWLQLNEADW